MSRRAWQFRRGPVGGFEALNSINLWVSALVACRGEPLPGRDAALYRHHISGHRVALGATPLQQALGAHEACCGHSARQLMVSRALPPGEGCSPSCNVCLCLKTAVQLYEAKGFLRTLTQGACCLTVVQFVYADQSSESARELPEAAEAVRAQQVAPPATEEHEEEEPVQGTQGDQIFPEHRA